VVGRLYIRPTAHDLAFVRLGLDGRNLLALPSPTVYGKDVSFYGDDVTNGHSTICFDLGEAGGFVARSIWIERSVIHDCGRLPADNHEHGIYVENTRNVRIAWNLIYGNADRGIQLYPDAQRTSVVHNVIYGNGEGILFSGGLGTASSGALVAHNIISESNVRSNVESWYPRGNPKGTHNTVTDNCIGVSSDTPVNQSGGGFDASHNLLVEPSFANAAAHDFRFLAGSPCQHVVGDVSSAVASAI
jgi:parallel beta-helix repeat protein